jgi:hypothetical protein
MSALTVKKPKSRSQCYPFSMWRHIGTWHCSCISAPTDSVNSPMNGLIPHNIATTGRSSRLRMSGLL